MQVKHQIPYRSHATGSGLILSTLEHLIALSLTGRHARQLHSCHTLCLQVPGPQGGASLILHIPFFFVNDA